MQQEHDIFEGQLKAASAHNRESNIITFFIDGIC